MIYDNRLPINEEAMFNKYFKNPVYIVLMHSGTPLANIIKGVTGDDYSHACIAFNAKLDPMYSFGTKGKGEKGTGFAMTSPDDDFFKKFKSRYSVYIMFVTDKALENMKQALQYFIEKKDKLKYDIIGLFNIWFGKDSEDHEKYFCSRFVMELVSKAQELSKVPSLWKPSDITQLENISLVNRGFDMLNYNYRTTLKHCRAIQQGTYNPFKVVYENSNTFNFASNLNSEDFELTANMAKQKLEQLQQQNLLKCCNSIEVHPIEYGWAFAKYEIHNDRDIVELDKFAKFINSIIDTSVYCGYIMIPPMNIGDIGYLYIIDDEDSIQEAIKFYKNPARQIKAKMTKKKNDQIGKGKYDIASKAKLSIKKAPTKLPPKTK